MWAKTKSKKTVRLTQFKPMQEELLKIRLENAACLAALKELIRISERMYEAELVTVEEYKSAIERAKVLSQG